MDAKGKTIVPGFVDAHWHGSMGESGFIPQQSWINYASLSMGVTTIHDPSNDNGQVFTSSELQRTGRIVGPRIYSTGTILYGAQAPYTAVINNLDEALTHLKRQKAEGAISVKSYQQPRREQRQQVIEAARQTGMMVVPEGGSMYELNMSMIVDGHTGVEHALPVAHVYDDVKQFWPQTQVGYTPTLIVAYGGLDGEHYWYARTDVWKHPILSKYVPASVLQPRAVRRETAPEQDFNVNTVAKTATELARAGVKVNIGAHGQREGLGTHWEMWSFGLGGMTPLEALRTATINPAHYLGLDKDIGSLEAGKLADLVVINGDVLQDIRQSDRIDAVMVNGRLYDVATMNEKVSRDKPRKAFFFEGANGQTAPIDEELGHSHGEDEDVRRRTLLSAACAALLTACAAQAPVQAPHQAPHQAPAAKPRLVVFIAIDGLPMRQVMNERARFAPDGFRRFLDQGAWYASAHYSHGFTVTAAGHATMLTGAPPYRSGVIGNEWRDPQTFDAVYCTGDADHHYLGEMTARLAGTSPKNLKAETVGDVLRKTQPESKVIAISGKDRGAILPAGHLGTAYIYMGATGHFASSDYYMARHPQWVQEFNQSGAAQRYFGREWSPLAQDSSAAGWDQPWQNDAGNGKSLPVKITGGLSAPGPKFYAALLASPYADALSLDFARAAIAGEKLGADRDGKRGTDILSVSLSGHDYINHSFGPESRMSQEHLLQLDLLLQSFFQDLDQRIGRDQYLVMLTADHGFGDTPEWSKQHGLDAGRVTPAAVGKSMEDALAARFGAGPWLRGQSAMGVLFDEKKIQAAGLNPDAVYAVARDAVKAVPGIATAFTRAELASAKTSDPVLNAMRKSWDPERAAPLQIVIKPLWLLSSSSRGTSHGTPWEYDTHVPLLTWGPQWLGRGEIKSPVGVVDIAPTLSAILGLRAPDRSEGQMLPQPH